MKRISKRRGLARLALVPVLGCGVGLVLDRPAVGQDVIPKRLQFLAPRKSSDSVERVGRPQRRDESGGALAVGAAGGGATPEVVGSWYAATAVPGGAGGLEGGGRQAGPQVAVYRPGGEVSQGGVYRANYQNPNAGDAGGGNQPLNLDGGFDGGADARTMESVIAGPTFVPGPSPLPFPGQAPPSPSPTGNGGRGMLPAPSAGNRSAPPIYADNDYYEEVAVDAMGDYDDDFDDDDEPFAGRVVSASPGGMLIDGEGATPLGEPWLFAPHHVGVVGKSLHAIARAGSRAGITAGVQGTFLSPSKEGVQSVHLTNLFDGSQVAQESELGFGGGVRTWAGLQADNVGFRAVYWTFQNAHYEPDFPLKSPSLRGSSSGYRLDAETVDIEVFNTFCFGQSIVRSSLGARYASLQRQVDVLGRGKVAGVELLGLASGQADLSGWGVVAGLEGYHPLDPWFCADCSGPSLCHFFWKLQGSGLAAESRVAAATEVYGLTSMDSPAMAYSRDEAKAYWDGTVLTGMLQAGIDYRIPLTSCYRPTYLDLMVGFEGQVWQTGKVGAASESYAFFAGEVNGQTFGGSVEASSRMNPNSIGMFGFVFGTTLTY